MSTGVIHNLMHKKQLIFVRHGSTKMNEEGDKIRGWSNPPLSDKGKREAEDIGIKLKKEDFDGIISSDLIRARETAEIISKKTGKPIYGFTRSLRPWDAGIFTGEESNRIISKLNDYIEHSSEIVPEGESFDNFKKRFLTAIEDIKKHFKNKKVLIVAHHRNNVMLNAWQAVGQKSDFKVDKSEMEKKGIPPSDYKIYFI